MSQSEPSTTVILTEAAKTLFKWDRNVRNKFKIFINSCVRIATKVTRSVFFLFALTNCRVNLYECFDVILSSTLFALVVTVFVNFAGYCDP